jgi:hypothetical protein
MAEMPPTGSEGPGRDVFPDPDAAGAAAAVPVAPTSTEATAAGAPQAAAVAVIVRQTTSPVSQGREARPGNPVRVVAVDGAAARLVAAVPGARPAVVVSASAGLPVVRTAVPLAGRVSPATERGGGADEQATGEVPAMVPAAGTARPDAPAMQAPAAAPAAVPDTTVGEPAPMASAPAGDAVVVAEAPADASRFSPAALAAALVGLLGWSAEPAERGVSRGRAG